MAKGREKNGYSAFFVILKAVAVGLAVSSVVLLLFSFVMTKKDIPFSLINPLSAGLLMLASFLAGFIAAKDFKRRGMLTGALCGAVIFVAALIASAMFSAEIGAAAAIKLAISALSGAIGGILGVNSDRKRK